MTKPSDPVALAEDGVVVPHEGLLPETLHQLIEAFVLRNGTDYGEREATLDLRVSQIKQQLDRGDVKIVFDLSSDSCSIVPARDVKRLPA